MFQKNLLIPILIIWSKETAKRKAEGVPIKLDQTDLGRVEIFLFKLEVVCASVA